MNLGDVKENLQSKSQYQKVFDDLQLYNQYQEINNNPQSQQQYQIQDNEYLDQEQSLSRKIDKLANTIIKQIMKRNKLNEWLRNVVDKQVRISEDLKKEQMTNKKSLMRKYLNG